MYEENIPISQAIHVSTSPERIRNFCPESKNAHTMAAAFHRLCQSHTHVFLAGPAGSDFELWAREYDCARSGGEESLLVLEPGMLEKGRINDLLSLCNRKSLPSAILVEGLDRMRAREQEVLNHHLSDGEPWPTVFFYALPDFPVDGSVPSGYPEFLAKRAREALFEIPALSRRRCDMAHFVWNLIEEYSQRVGWSKLSAFDDDAIALLVDYGWPGNYTEIKRVIRLLVRTCETGGMVTRDVLENAILTLSTSPIA